MHDLVHRTDGAQRYSVPPSIQRILSEPWLIYDQSLPAFLEHLQADINQGLLFNGANAADQEEEKSYEVVDGVAKLEFRGVVGKRLGWIEKFWYGMMDLDDFNAQLSEAAEDESVESIEIDFDSPGGSVTGVLETMAHVRKVDASKPVIARTETLMASAAYFIASQARRLHATESSRVGSIGTMVTYLDRTKMMEEYGIKVNLIKNKEGTYKGAGMMGQALTKAQEEQIQESLQFLHDRSTTMIKERRPMLKDDSMKGQVMFGTEAYWSGSGLVDDLI